MSLADRRFEVDFRNPKWRADLRLRLGCWSPAWQPSVPERCRYLISHNPLLSGVLGLCGAGLAVVSGSLKRLLEPVKLIKEIEKLDFEIKEKRLADEKRIVTPSPEELDRHRVPYRAFRTDLFASYRREAKPVANENFVERDNEPEINPKEKS